MTTVLITGANGFLGKNLQAAILAQNLHIEYLFLTPPSSKLDMLDNRQVMSFFAENKPDIIIHISALCGGIGLNKQRPADLTHLNNKMTVNLFDAIREFGVKQLIGLGSICSYPMYSPIPFNENDIWNGKSESSNRGYGEAKKMMITELQSHMEQYGLRGVVLMPTNMFGPYEHFNDIKNSHVIPSLITKFVNAVDNNLPEVRCWGTGTATRDFIYAPSVCKAILTALTKNISEYEPINIGAGWDISINDLTFIIAKMTGFTGKIVFDGSISDGQPKRLLGIKRAADVLGWAPDISFEDGLAKTIKWYQEHKAEILAREEKK